MRKLIFIFLLSTLFGNKLSAQDGYIGEIRMFAGNYAPIGWALCQGQLLPISGNETLFNIIGTTYGGDGQTTFALPDLRGRAPIHQGQGLGLSNLIIGENGGTETVTLTKNQIPAHNHLVNAVTSLGNQNTPTGNFRADTNVLDKEYSSSTANTTMSSTMTGNTGGNQPVSIRSPYIAINYIISLYGIYPTPN